jgi:hypothetical protein
MSVAGRDHGLATFPELTPGAIEHVAVFVAAGRLYVPIAARFSIDDIRASVEL